MPKINTKLASQGLTPQSTGSAQLSPVAVSPNSGMISTAGGRVTAKFRAPQINPNAANIKYTPIKPNDIIVNPAVDAASQLAQQWAQSAFKFQERQAQADADQMVAAYREELKRNEIGYENDDGEWVNGYLYREGKEATEGFQAHRGLLDSRMEDLLAGVDPTVREKAAIRLANERGAAQDRAAKHNAQQFKVVEQEIRYEADQQALSLAREYGPSYFLDGRMDEHLDKYYLDDPDGRDAAAEFIVKNTMQEVYNAETRNPEAGPMQAYEAAQAVYDSSKHHMSEEKQVALDTWLVTKLDQARTKERTMAAGNIALAQEQALQNNPSFLSDYAKAGNWEGFFNQWEVAKGVFAEKTPLQQIAAQTKMIQGTIDTYVARGGFTDILDKTEAAHEIVNAMMASGGGDNFDPMVAGQIMSYVNDELPDKLIKQQKALDTRATFGLSAYMAEFEGQGVPAYRPPPPGMLPDAAEKWDKAQEQYANQLVKGLTPEQFQKHANVSATYKGELVIRPLTDEQLEDAWDMVATGDMAANDYFRIAAKSQQLSDPRSSEPAYKGTTEFKEGTTRIDVVAKQGIFDGDVKEPDKDDPRYAEWKAVHDTNRSEALNSWDEYSASEYAAGRRPDYKEWYSTYITVKNNGNLVSNSLLKRNVKEEEKRAKDAVEATQEMWGRLGARREASRQLDIPPPVEEPPMDTRR